MSWRILAATLRLLIVPHALGLAICILYLSFVFMFVFMIDIAFGLYCYCFSVACEVVDCAAQPQPWSGGCLHWDTARQSGPSTQILVHPPKYVPCGNINVDDTKWCDEHSSVKFCEVDCLEIDWGRLRVWGVIRARVICPPTAFCHPSPPSQNPPLLLSTSSISSLSFPPQVVLWPSFLFFNLSFLFLCLSLSWSVLSLHHALCFYWVLQHFSTMFLILLLPSQCQSNLRPKGGWQSSRSSSNSRRTWGSRSCNCRRSTWRRSWCCLAHFPDFLPSVDKVQLSTKITSDFKGEVEYSSLSTKLAVLSV